MLACVFFLIQVFEDFLLCYVRSFPSLISFVGRSLFILFFQTWILFNVISDYYMLAYGFSDFVYCVTQAQIYIIYTYI